MRNVIDVPDIDHPTAELCYAEFPGLVRCDRAAGHQGPHRWTTNALRRELVALLREARAVDATQVREPFSGEEGNVFVVRADRLRDRLDRYPEVTS